MDNNNDNQFMSIFNDAHVDPNTIQANEIPNQEINSEQSQDIEKIIGLNQEQINEQIVEQSEILDSNVEIKNNIAVEQPRVESKKSEPINYFAILIFSLILGVVVFAGMNFMDKQMSKPKDAKTVNELVEQSYNFESSFSAFIEQYSTLKPITNTISCTANLDNPTWHATEGYKFSENCSVLISTYESGTSSVETPKYGVIVIDSEGIKEGTYFKYDNYTCTYTIDEEKLFKCEKTE